MSHFISKIFSPFCSIKILERKSRFFKWRERTKTKTNERVSTRFLRHTDISPSPQDPRLSEGLFSLCVSFSHTSIGVATPTLYEGRPGKDLSQYEGGPSVSYIPLRIPTNGMVYEELSEMQGQSAQVIYGSQGSNYKSFTK
jgi:hypothetical protein